MNVIYLYRRREASNFSIETIFDLIRTSLTKGFTSTEFRVSPGMNRLKAIIEARKLKADIYHITGDINFISLGLKGQRAILTVHDVGYLENLTTLSIKKIIYKLFWWTLPLKKVKHVTTVSEYTKSKLITYFPFVRDKISVVPNPLNPIYVFNEKKFSAASPVILHIGSSPHKNLMGLIQAVRDISCELCIVGFPTKEEIAALTEYKVNYKMHQQLSTAELYQKYVECDVVYFASFHEGFGMPIIEGNAVGRPVITSNLTAMPEVASDSACIVDPYNTSEIREAILKIMNDQHFRESLIEKGKINARKFAVDAIVNKYQEVYRMVHSMK